MKKILLLLIFTFNLHAVLLDKIAGVINDQLFTLSEINRMIETLPARQEIAPMIYNKPSYSKRDMLKQLQRTHIIRDKLSEMGFVVSDDSVESRINETESRLGLKRDDLLEFLKSKNITFNEYFELIREAMEFNIFNGRIIAPLVNITDQEIKNYYYKLKSSNNTLSFKYRIIDFYLNKGDILDREIKGLPLVLEEFQKTGNIPQQYKSIETNDLGELRGDDLPKDLSALLRETDEGSFSKPYIKDDLVHIFFVKSKDLTESQDFLKRKDQIYGQIFMERSKDISQAWLSRESLNYYILDNL